MKGTHWLAIMICFNLALAASAAVSERGEVGQTALPAVFPGTHWAEKSPSQVGLDAAKLEALKEATKAKEGCVIRHGYLVYQWGDISTVRRWASAYKPVNSTMLLFALKEGLIDSVDDPIVPWVQRVFSGKDLIAKDHTMTFRHLCNMTSGYGLPERVLA